MNKKKVVHKVRIKQKIKKSEICASHTPKRCIYIPGRTFGTAASFLYTQNKCRTARIRIIMCCIKSNLSIRLLLLQIRFLSFSFFFDVAVGVVYRCRSRRCRIHIPVGVVR